MLQYVHELIDVATVLAIMAIVMISAMNQLDVGDAIIDLSNENFRDELENIQELAKVTLFEADLRNTQEIEMTDISSLESGDNVIVVGPSQEVSIMLGTVEALP